MTISSKGKLSELRPSMRPTYKDFELETPIASDNWMAPARAEVRGDWLACPTDQPWREVGPGKGILEGFVRIYNAPDERIAEFAIRWGPLFVCGEHMLPPLHAWRGGTSPACDPILMDDAWLCPVLTWRFWSRQALALLRLGIALRIGDVGKREDWEAISDEARVEWREKMWQLRPHSPLKRDSDGNEYVMPFPDYGRSLTDTSAQFRRDARDAMEKRLGLDVNVKMARGDLAHAIATWIALGTVLPRFRWTGEDPEVVLTSSGLFSAIGLQVMMAVSRSNGLTFCSECGMPYVPKRRPVAGQRHYCGECGETGVPQRDAAAAYRARQRGERQDGKARKR